MTAKQRAENIGDNCIIVQIEGSNNTVVSNQAHLLLVPWERRVQSSDDAIGAQLLTPYRLFTELVGRDEELGDLLSWAKSEKPITIRLMTGRAGAGKTRMAIELMRALSESKDGIWQTGFVRPSELERFANQQNLASWGWQHNTLVVIDYAAIASTHLRKWFQELADHSMFKDRKLRILLLERAVGEGIDWWDDLTSIGYKQSCSRLMNYFDPITPIQLHPLSKVEDRRRLFNNMAQEAARHSGKSHVPSLPEPEQSPRFDEQLTNEIWGDPLYLMMAALTALDHGTDIAETLSLSRTDLARSIAKRECERLVAFATNGQPHKIIIHLAAYATLCRGIAKANVLGIVKEELEHLGYEWLGGAGVLVELLKSALPSLNGDVGFVEPDIVGEALILGVFEESALDVLLRTAEHAADTVFGTLIRTVQDYSVDDPSKPIKWIEELVDAGMTDDPGLLTAIDSALPLETLLLRQLSVDVNMKLLNCASISRQPATRARLQLNLATRLSYLGKREDALDIALEATNLYSKLEHEHPGSFLPELATSLNNLATMLSDMGKQEEALAIAQETVGLRRKLIQIQPKLFLPSLIMSLNNLANRFNDLKRGDEALENAQEAVDILDNLEQTQHKELLPYIAGSHTNLAATLSILGKDSEAMNSAEKSAGIYYQMIQMQPDAYLPYYAASLCNMATMLDNLDRNTEALQSAQKATVVYNNLAFALPEKFLPNFARSLAIQAKCYCKLDQNTEGLESITAALRAILQPLQDIPSVHSALAVFVLGIYLDIAEHTNTELDTQLLAPIVSLLKGLDKNKDNE